MGTKGTLLWREKGGKGMGYRIVVEVFHVNTGEITESGI